MNEKSLANPASKLNAYNVWSFENSNSSSFWKNWQILFINRPVVNFFFYSFLPRYFFFFLQYKFHLWSLQVCGVAQYLRNNGTNVRDGNLKSAEEEGEIGIRNITRCMKSSAARIFHLVHAVLRTSCVEPQSSMVTT